MFNFFFGTPPPNSKVIVAGTRNFNDYQKVKEYLDDFRLSVPIQCIVSGGATGADKLGERYAKENNIPCVIFPAHWEQHGKSAGPIRNKQMAQYADYLIAFWDNKSKGTKSMITEMDKLGKLFHVVSV